MDHSSARRDGTNPTKVKQVSREVTSSVPFAFYLPEDPDYTIVDSALDSIRFLRAVSEPDNYGDLFCRSVDATPEGLEPYRGRFMEGVGYCADSVFGGHYLVRFGRAVKRPELEAMGWSYLDHTLAGGFFDDPDVPVRLYRDTDSGRFLDNLEGRDGYIEHGHIARVGHQLLQVAHLDPQTERAERSRAIAIRVAEWIDESQRCDNGWFPRRSRPDGSVFPYAVDSLGPTDLPGLEYPDPISDRSGAGSMALHFLAEATRTGLYEATTSVRAAAQAFVDAGGHFGSVNTDTEDLAENVSFALGFQALLAAADVLEDSDLSDFAFERCLSGLEQFELISDLNGCATKGLLYMETSWNAACTWEIAISAAAYLDAHSRRPKREFLLKSLTMLRGLAKHHHGDLGFLTEAVDWDGHSPKTRHLGRAGLGDIGTTHPFLNNLHLLEPTVLFLETAAIGHEDHDRGSGLYDVEGNRLCGIPIRPEPWMRT